MDTMVNQFTALTMMSKEQMRKYIVRRTLPEQIEYSFSDAIPPLLQRIYAHRGVSCDADMQRELSVLLPADTLKGLKPALVLLQEALANQQAILVVGDFDADGATSSALAVLALQAMGAQRVDYLVPNRFEYGYGLTPEIVEVAKSKHPDLIITVDNGISSVDGVLAANAAGIKVLITDHHLPGQILPDAAAIVNPNQTGCDFPSKNLAGVGVIFYLMSALRTALNDAGWFALQNLPVPNMADFLDLVALGTVADVVPLDRNNRVLVHQGLRRIRAGRCRPGISALIAVAGRNQQQLVAADLGFTVGPRLNAAGRLDDMSHGIECLLTTDTALAAEMAQELDALNRDRRAIEGSMQQEAMASLNELQHSLATNELDAQTFGLCLFDKTWHQGVIGILASRIKDKFHRPVIAFALADSGQHGTDMAEQEIKGSARSIPGFHIRDALDTIATRHPGLVNKFGGHAMAAGLTIQLKHYEAFQQAFDQEVRRQLSLEDLRGQIWSDGELKAKDLTLEQAETLREHGPWGQAFPEPLFDGEFKLVQQRIVGEKHLKMVLALPESNAVIDAIAFNVDLNQWPTSSDKIKLAYRLDVNEFRGEKSVQFVAEYLESVEAS